MTARRTCKVPGCSAKLCASNRTGVCRSHNHVKPYCNCIQCGGVPPVTPAQPVEAPETPPGTRSVSVAYPTGNSGIAGRASVTMLALPWETDQ